MHGEARSGAERAARLQLPSDIVAFLNLSNRMACTLDMMPDREFHRLDR